MSEQGRLDALGRLEDLPADYVKALAEQHLVPLWPSLRGLLPAGAPRPSTRPAAWSYKALRGLLLRAGELTPIEKAERRVLVLTNPGHGLDSMKVSPAMYLGLQLLLPGEWAPSHRHTPNAVRMIVEGSGAYTTVDGERCSMERGDLILTPSGLWHEHGHDGDQPVVWLDVLDVPLVYQLEVSYAVEGHRQEVKAGHGDASYASGGIAPTPLFLRSDQRYPMLRYPWSTVRSALERQAANNMEAASVQVTYVNPETGEDAQNILGFHALMLRPGASQRLPIRSPACVFHVVEGQVDMRIASESFTLIEADTSCAPGFAEVSLQNRQSDKPAFVFIADEGPLHRKLGLYECRG